jgi:hypothetical protein
LIPEINMFKRIASLLLASVLASSCGGGGDAGTSVFSGTGASTGTGTGTGTGTTAASTSDLILTVSAAQLPNTGSASVSVTVTAVDASRNTLAAVPVTLSADAGAVLGSVSGSTTGADGTVTGSLGIGGDPSNRLVTITAVSGSISKTATVQVVGTTVSATLVPVVQPGATNTVTYHVVNKNSVAMGGQAIQVVAAGFTPAQVNATTDSSGQYIYSYTAPTTTGAYTITATVAGVTDTESVSVQPSGTVGAVTPATPLISSVSASISANPSVIAVNVAGSTANQSQIRALFFGTGNVPLQNVRARFDLDGDPNSVGGTIAAGSGILYSDANGVVTTSYVPGTRSSPTNGVKVRVCYGLTDTDANLTSCALSQIVTLTVASTPLAVSIGTNAKVIVNALTYEKDFIISVADAAGAAVSNVDITVSIDLPFYRKGHYNVGVAAWAKAGPLASGDAAICANEDTNRNGVLDPGEDGNVDGQLWPRKADVIVSADAKTAADGTATMKIVYAQDHGSWVDTLITVSASGVSGSEGRTTYLVSPVPVDSASITDLVDTPAYATSPYGVTNSCANPN